MIKKTFMFFSLLLILSIINAENCRYQTELTTDCNIMVKPLDSNSNECTASCNCNLTLWNPVYEKIIDNNKMNWESNTASFWLDTNALLNVSGEWIIDINCFALDVNRYTIGQIMIVDLDTNTLLHDINSNCTGGNGGDCPTEEEIWTHGTRTLTDYSGVWSETTRTLTDYNQSLLWQWLRPLYNEWYRENAPRYCAINDPECVSGKSIDSNQVRYYEETTQPTSLITLFTENWILGTIIGIFIFFIILIILKSR